MDRQVHHTPLSRPSFVVHPAASSIGAGWSVSPTKGASYANPAGDLGPTIKTCLELGKKRSIDAAQLHPAPGHLTILGHQKRKFNAAVGGLTVATNELVNDFEDSSQLLEESARSTTELSRIHATLYCQEFVQYFVQRVLDDLNCNLGTEHPDKVIYRKLRFEAVAYGKTVRDAKTDDYRPKAIAAYYAQPLTYPIHHALCETLKMHGINPQHWVDVRRVVNTRNDYAHPRVDDESPELVISAYIHTHALLPQDASALTVICNWLVQNHIGVVASTAE